MQDSPHITPLHVETAKDDGKRYKGVTYWQTFDEAERMRDNLITAGASEARIVGYERGYAVQLYKSGVYV